VAGLDADVVVIGAGVVGLACGAELARRGRNVVVLERHGTVGHETSSRNSEVIHAGIYYPEGSLKARACVEGRGLVYARCAAFGVPHARIGKLIVANGDEEEAALAGIAARARANRAGAIEEWDAAAVARVEPRVRASAALWSPETGIVDAHGLMRSYHGELEAQGGSVVLRTAVRDLVAHSFGWYLETTDGDGERFEISCETVVNAAGLAADRVAARAGVDVAAKRWQIHPCRGDYFSVAPGLGALARHLVYPVPPGDGGLGVHLTLDLGGRIRLGPDVTYQESLALEVDAGKADAFARAASRYLPELTAAHLSPEMAGIRPKLHGPGEPFRDFVVEESSDSGAPGMVHLVGIESPGLTAAGALARRAADLVEGRGRSRDPRRSD